MKDSALKDDILKKAVKLNGFNYSKFTFSNVDIANVKRIVPNSNLLELHKLYKTMMIRDYRINADIKELKQDIISLDKDIIGNDERVVSFVKEYFKGISFSRILFEMASSVAYGVSVFNVVWNKKLINGQRYLVPYDFKFIDQIHISSDDGGLFVKDINIKKHYLEDNPNFLLHLNESFNEATNSSTLKLVAFVFAIKQYILNHSLSTKITSSSYIGLYGYKYHIIGILKGICFFSYCLLLSVFSLYFSKMVTLLTHFLI